MSLLITCIISCQVDANPKQGAERDFSFERPYERRRHGLFFAFRFLLPMTPRSRASRSFPVARHTQRHTAVKRTTRAQFPP